MSLGQLQEVDDESKDPTFINSKCGPTSADSKIEFDLELLSGEEREKMENLLNGHQDVFAKSSSELDLTTLVEHRIETGEAVPAKQPPRRLPNSLKTVVEDQVGEMLENNIIKPSNSPWSSTDSMDNLAGHQYFSTLDLASGYWQVPVDESSQDKTLLL